MFKIDHVVLGGEFEVNRMKWMEKGTAGRRLAIVDFDLIEQKTLDTWGTRQRGGEIHIFGASSHVLSIASRGVIGFGVNPDYLPRSEQYLQISLVVQLGCS